MERVLSMSPLLAPAGTCSGTSHTPAVLPLMAEQAGRGPLLCGHAAEQNEGSISGQHCFLSGHKERCPLLRSC